MAGVAQRGSGRSLTGWGRTTPSRARVLGPLPDEQLRAQVTARPPGGVLARGAGRSYGDAAQNAGGVVLHPVTVPRVHVHPDTATVQVSASTSFTDLLTRIVPEGLLLPVLPGTRHLTVGGAVAADVHGKNQRSDGGLGRWITEIEILDGTGEVRRLTPDGDPEWFRATVGGLGLTGVILGATIRLLRIRSARMLVSTGFIEYQCVVPEGAHGVIRQILEAAQRHRCATFLGTLRRFGPESGGHLSYPRPGWSVSIDMPAGHRQLGPMLDDLDLRVAAAGGRVGLAGDSRLSGRTCAAMYPRLAQWWAAASRLDPAGVFCSDLGQRLGLRRAGATSPGRKHAG